MRRATAYSNSCSQVVLVYLHPFRCSSLLKCVLQPKIAEKSPKLFILKVQGRLRSLMLNHLKLVSSYCYSKQQFYVYLQALDETTGVK